MRRNILLLLFGLGVNAVFAQNSVVITGSNATGNEGSVSYSVGQIATNTISSSDGTISEGVQQSYEIFTIGFDEISKILLSANVFPNPSTEYLILTIFDCDITNLSYQLFDINGKLIKGSKIKGTETRIDMQNMESNLYFVHVFNGNQEIKTFKIIKTI